MLTALKNNLNQIKWLNLILAALIALPSIALAQDAGEAGGTGKPASRPRGKPVPPSTIIQAAKGESVENVFSAMYFSDRFDSTDPRAIGSVSPMAYIGKRITDFTASKAKKPNAKLTLKADFYGFDDPTAVVPTINAAKAGIATQVITDFNQYLDCTDPVSSDWSKCTIKKGTMGDALTNMLTVLKFNAVPNGIASQPVFNKGGQDVMIDIYHRKQLLTITEENGKEHIDYDLLTANMTPNDRVNRWWVVADQDFAQYANKHFDDTFAAFQQGGKIKDIPNPAPLRKVYEDGHWVEFGFTDGGINLNDRLGNLLDFILANPNAVEVETITGAEFAPTKADLFTKMFSVIKQYPKSLMKMISDLRFTGVDGYGQLERGAGFDDFREMGGAVFGVGSSLAKQIQSYVYSAPAIDPNTGKPRDITVLDGAPTNVKVLHDKTIKMNLVVKDAGTFNKAFGTNFVNGQRISFILTGTFNLSNHATNAEVQVAMFVDADSWIAKAIDASIDGLIKYQPDFCLEMVDGIARSTIAKILGIAASDVPLTLVKQARAAILARDFTTLTNIVRKGEELGSKVKSRPSKEVVDAGITQADKFLQWYKSNVPQSKTDDAFRLRKLAVLASLITDKKANVYKNTARLNSIIWRPGLSDQQIVTLMDGGWQALGFTGHPAQTANSATTPKGASPSRRSKAPQPEPLEGSIITTAPSSADPEERDMTSAAAMAMQTDIDAQAAQPAMQTANILTSATPLSVAKAHVATHSGFAPTAHFYIEDFDDNFAITSRKIFVRTKDTHHVVALSSAKYAVIYEDIGHNGVWANYEFFDTSFNDFAKGQLRHHIGNEHTPILVHEKGPSFASAQEACSQQDTCNRFFFNTAGSDPSEIHDYLLALQKAGFLKFVPPVENILTGATTPQKKLDNVRKVMKIANETPIAKDAQQVLAEDGSTLVAKNTVGYSDDSPPNFKGVLNGLTADVGQNLYPNVKASIFYTGKEDKTMNMQALVVMGDGPRQQLAIEVDEYSTQRGAVIIGNECKDFLKPKHASGH